MRKLIALMTTLVLAVFVGACDETPTMPDGAERPTASMEGHGPSTSSTSGLVNSNAPFKNWHQGFNHGTAGWYGMETAGELGWCGTVETRDRRSSDLAPSAGRGYAVVAQDGCNDLWSETYGAGLVGAPWAPGPAFSALGGPFPDAGYLMELDVYLDPSYEAVGPAAGTFVFEFPAWMGAVIGYSVSFMTLDDGAFHYLWLPVWEGDGELLVDTHPITEAGWYTFRFVFTDAGGSLAADFELADRGGATLFTKSMGSTFFSGTPVSDFDPANVGSGYTWFTSISRGLELPIDEYHVRPLD